MSRILVVDDDEVILALIKGVLEKNLYEVKTLKRGNTTLQTVELVKPDLILLDIKLDDYDGRDLCWEIKGNKRLNWIKVILMSGDKDSAMNLSSYNADDFIIKPINFKTLLLKIKHHIEISKSWFL